MKLKYFQRTEIFSTIARQLLGWTNYWTAALVPGWISCLLAIFLERPSRRTALATYVSTVVRRCQTSWCFCSDK